MASVGAAGAGHTWITRPDAADLAALRFRMDFAEFIERRVLTMTPTDRRQFNALMKWTVPMQH